MAEENKELKKCSGCGSTMLLSFFKINRKGEYNKTCIQCGETRKKRNEKYKCEHGRIKSKCRECKGGSICPHAREKSQCKECGGSQICPHDRIKSRCKECKGSSICPHDRVKSQCKECEGGSICPHDRIKSTCKECGGSQICPHDRRKSTCKECEGGSICPHDRQKSQCKECEGGSICPHDRIKSTCKECGGSQICPHDRIKSKCKECDPIGHLSGIVSNQVRNALKSNKSKHSIEYLDCTIEEFKEHIKNQFEEGMNWDNHGEWHIDHIIPIKYQNPTLEEVIERLHWKNTQPLWASENIAKGNRFIG
jgi:hypothetical protein